MNPKFTSQIFQRWFLNQTSRQFATNQLQSSAESLGSEAGHWRARSHRRQRLIFLRFRLRILRVPQIAICAIPIWPWTLDGHCHGIPPGSKHRSVWLEGGIESVGKFEILERFGKQHLSKFEKVCNHISTCPIAVHCNLIHRETGQYKAT
jgi:hypothetical protein